MGDQSLAEAKSWQRAALARVVRGSPSAQGKRRPASGGSSWVPDGQGPWGSLGSRRHFGSKPLILCANTEVLNPVKETLRCMLSSSLDKYPR